MTEEEVLALNDPKESLHYCKINKDANIKLHEDVIVNDKNSGYAGYACEFAADIPGANIERLQELVINCNDAWHIYMFGLYVKKSNKEELFRAILKTGDKDHIYFFY